MFFGDKDGEVQNIFSLIGIAGVNLAVRKEWIKPPSMLRGIESMCKEVSVSTGVLFVYRTSPQCSIIRDMQEVAGRWQYWIRTGVEFWFDLSYD